MFSKKKPAEVEPEPVDAADTSDTLPPAGDVGWTHYKLRKFAISSAYINGRYCRVSELGEGFLAVEAEGVEPTITEEPYAVCLIMAEKSAWTGARVRRFIDHASGEETYR